PVRCERQRSRGRPGPLLHGERVEGCTRLAIRRGYGTGGQCALRGGDHSVDTRIGLVSTTCDSISSPLASPGLSSPGPLHRRESSSSYSAPSRASLSISE